MFPPVGIEPWSLMNLWFQVQYYPVWTKLTFACKIETSGSLYSHVLLIVVKSFQFLEVQKSSGAWADLLSITWQVSKASAVNIGIIAILVHFKKTVNRANWPAMWSSSWQIGPRFEFFQNICHHKGSKLTPIHASVIYSIAWIRWIHWIPFPFRENPIWVFHKWLSRNSANSVNHDQIQEWYVYQRYYSSGNRYIASASNTNCIFIITSW